jgi:flagellar biosynthesis protein FlhG
MPREHGVPRLIAVAGGKGGVGKSTIAANLAVAIARLGHRVTIVDADLGAANLHTMFGVLHPEVCIADFLDGRISSLAAARRQVGPSTLSLVPGTSRPGSANLSRAHKLRLLRGLTELDTEVVLVDLGAGTSFNVVDVLAAADQKLLVVTPQLPSVHNAYALLKACVHRVARKLATDDIGQGLIDSALGHEKKARTIPQLLEVLRPLDPALSGSIGDLLGRFGVGLVANQVESDAEARALARMGPLIQDQLMISAPVLAAIRRAPALAGSLRAGANTLLDPTTDGAHMFRHLARSLLDADLARLRGQHTRTTHPETIPLWVLRDLLSEREDVAPVAADG